MRYVATIGIALTVFASLGSGAPKQSRGCRVCVASDAPEPIQRMADRVVERGTANPTLKAMSDGTPITRVNSDALLAGPIADRAFTHLVVVGLADDELVRTVWQNEADIDGKRIYVHGVGRFEGDIGFVESERNPFLYSWDVQRVPYTAMTVTITGTTIKGVKLALEAFLNQGLTNGVIAGEGWVRYDETLLDFEPLEAGFTVPNVLPDRVGTWERVGLTQCAEADYRGVMATAGTEPLSMWRAKYYRPGEWDHEGAKHTYVSYLASLHRRAYGNSILAMQFPDQQRAREAAQRIAASAGMKRRANGAFRGPQPIPSSKGFRDPGNPKPGMWKETFTLSVNRDWVVFSSLPEQ